MSASSFAAPSQNWALASLTEASLASMPLEYFSLRKGTPIFRPEDNVDYVYFPTDGMISVVGYDADGGSVEAATIGREGFFGGLQALGTGIIHNEHIVQAPGGCCRTSVDEFKSSVHNDPSIRQMHDCNVQSMVEQAIQSIICVTFHNVSSRLCRWILTVRDHIGRDELPLTQEFLAQMLGCQRSSVSLIAHSLQAAGLIRYRRGRIEVVDLQGLEDSACECYALIRGTHERAFGTQHR